jgi:hypothetical protein
MSPILSRGGTASGDSDQGAEPGGDTGLGGPKTGAVAERQLSLVEYMNTKEPVTNGQRIAVFAAYREEIEKKGNFAKGDLEGYFAKAKLAAPGNNYTRDYKKAVSEGWIHDDGANSYLTQTGQRAVAAGFGGKAKPRGKAAKKAARKKGKPE